MDALQDFFNKNPVLGGIIVFIIISFIVVFLYFLFFWKGLWFGIKRKTKVKTNENINETTELIEEEIEEIDNSIYYMLGFNSSGNLMMENLNENISYEKPTKEDFLNVLNNENSKLVLPENKVQIKIIYNEENEREFTTLEEIKDKNLFVFKAFVKFMQTYDMPWAISKFAYD